MTDLSKDRGFLLGDGVFDTLVAFNGVPVEGERHLARLVAQAAEIGIEVDAADIRSDWGSALSRHGAAPCILRSTVTRGASERGLWPATAPVPTRIVSATQWSPSLMAGRVSLSTSSIRRNEQAPTARLKSLSYLDNVLAAREAAARGADDALMLNTSGAVACTTIANVFALRGSRLVTPGLSEGVLAGTMRALVLDLAPTVGLSVAEPTMSLADLVRADLVFLTNSVRFLRPVSALDGKEWQGDLPPAFVALREAVARHVADATGYRLAWA